MGAKNRNITRRIAHAVLLLERGVVLLIDHDQAQAGHRREDREPGTEHDARLAGKGGSPVALARRFGQFAVQRDNAGFGETRPDPAFQLRRQVDFRHQQQHLLAFSQRPLDQAQINLGLAATSHAMQQMR